MLTLKFIKENTNEVLKRLRIRNLNGTIILKQIIAADNERIELQQQYENYIKFKKETSTLLIKQLKLGNKEIIESLKISLQCTKNLTQHITKRINHCKNILHLLLLEIPNLPHISVPSSYNKNTTQEL